jgi:hypothetical protein
MDVLHTALSEGMGGRKRERWIELKEERGFQLMEKTRYEPGGRG